jgi:hypothetical protein
LEIKSIYDFPDIFLLGNAKVTQAVISSGTITKNERKRAQANASASATENQSGRIAETCCAIVGRYYVEI